MTILIILGVIFTLILGFSLSGLLVSTLQTNNKIVKSVTFVLLGNVFSIFVMAITIFMVWPSHV